MSTLRVSTIQNASSSTANLTLDASGNATVGNTLVMGSSFKRNRIINGDMRVDQRATAITTSGYSVDRWGFAKSDDATESVAQNSDAPAGFSYSLRNTISVGDATIGAGQLSTLYQIIEGFNTADLAYGTDNAKTVTVSFWVKATQTGTYSCCITNAAQNRTCWKTFTVSASNTWENKILTFTGPNASVGGTWNTTNGAGLYLYFLSACGSTFQGGSDGVWNTSTFYAPSTITNGIGTNGNIWAITGVQLEVGSVATPYERQIYSEQLAQCQRYYWQINSDGTFAGIASGQMNGATTARFTLRYPQPMRAAPTVSFTNIGNLIVNQGGTDLTPSALTSYTNTTNLLFDLTTGTGSIGRGSTVIFNQSASSSMQASAEL